MANRWTTIVLGTVLLSAPALAQPRPAAVSALTGQRIAPVPDADAIPLYPGMRAGGLIERWSRFLDGQRVVRNVTRPTLTPILPEPAKATGAAVVIIPGGGFQFVAMDNEGWPVGRWLAERGIAAFVLKYRTNETPDDERAWAAQMVAMFSRAGRDDGSGPAIREPRATEDALAAMRMVRARASEGRVDPARVGVLGLSAGAMTSLNLANAADETTRPAFLGYVYGPMKATNVPPQAPPMFAALAIDDPLFGRQGFGIVESWRQARRPVELHVYQKGGHGYGGKGKPNTTTTAMMDQFALWLASNGWLGKAR